MAIGIAVVFRVNSVIFHSYLKLPEGTYESYEQDCGCKLSDFWTFTGGLAIAQIIQNLDRNPDLLW